MNLAAPASRIIHMKQPVVLYMVEEINRPAENKDYKIEGWVIGGVALGPCCCVLEENDVFESKYIVAVRTTCSELNGNGVAVRDFEN